MYMWLLVGAFAICPAGQFVFCRKHVMCYRNRAPHLAHRHGWHHLTVLVVSKLQSTYNTDWYSTGQEPSANLICSPDGLGLRMTSLIYSLKMILLSCLYVHRFIDIMVRRDLGRSSPLPQGQEVSWGRVFKTWMSSVPYGFIYVCYQFLLYINVKGAF